MNTSKTAPKVKTAHTMFPGGDINRATIHLRMSDNSSRLVRVSDRPSNKFLNGLIGLEDTQLNRKFGLAFKGWRKPQ